MSIEPDENVIAATPAAREGLARLRVLLAGYGRVVVAYSGGIDSAFLLWAALDRLGAANVLGVTGVSPSLSREQLDEAARQASAIGAPHRLIATDEVEDPSYLANAPDRCYHCKQELYTKLIALARAEGFERVLDGSNVDDTRDVRPGFRAIRELGVASPLLEAGLAKNEIRALSRAAGLSAWDRPASPCLSSRVPHGTPISVALLSRIDRGEALLRRHVAGPVRLRSHGGEARIEVDAAQIAALQRPATRAALQEGLRALGYMRVTIDAGGYRQGGADRPSVAQPIPLLE